MGATERRKGLRGQQEVHRLFQSLGVDLDKLAGQGDRVWYLDNGRAVRLEIKNQPNRIRISQWIEQSESETPRTMTPMVMWKHNGRWRFDGDAEDLLGLLA